MMKKAIIPGLIIMFLASGCNKDEKLMKRLEGNWEIDNSLKTIHYKDGSSRTIEDKDNAGKLVISDGASDLEKQYDLFYRSASGDTLESINKLITDEYRNRMIMIGVYSDSTGLKNIVWTIEKEKKNKQIWITYGVDSTLFYPANNQNPGAADNWVTWQITLKRE